MPRRAQALESKRGRRRGSPSTFSVSDHFLVVVLFWAFTLHLFDIWCVVLLSAAELRAAVGDPVVLGFSHHRWMIALAAVLVAYALALVLDRRQGDSRLARIWRPLAYGLFVALFGLRLQVHARYTLDPQWPEIGSLHAPWRVHNVHLGLVREWNEFGPSPVLLSPDRLVWLPLPTSGRRSCVVSVSERHSHFTNETAYLAETFVRYDDLEMFLFQIGWGQEDARRGAVHSRMRCNPS